MVNVLCDDIRFAANAARRQRGVEQPRLVSPPDCGEQADPDTRLRTLERFLSLCHFPLATPQPVFERLAHAHLLVEQSFSDFGDLDLLILLKHQKDAQEQAVLVEAKVCTDTGSWKGIEDQWADFRSVPRG